VKRLGRQWVLVAVLAAEVDDWPDDLETYEDELRELREAEVESLG